MRRRRLLMITGVVAVAAGAGTAASHAGAAEHLSLDFHEAVTPQHPNDGAAGPVTSSAAIPNGEMVLVVVKGTVSAYEHFLWAPPLGWKICGTPEPAPLFPSPSILNNAVGTDAEFNFARPQLISRGGCAEFPRHQSLFEMNLGSGWMHYEPIGGQSSSPAADHQYTYLVTGEGKPISFREEDSNTDDNYGVYDIVLFDKESCKKGGWQTYPNMRFKNQGDCVSYFATKGKNQPAGSKATKPDLADLPD